MISEIYELMKRSDEASVVEKAHRNPRFVEDVVREMVRHVAESYPQLRDGGFMVARQENLETIHRHTVVAERTGLVSEVLDEVETGDPLPPPPHRSASGSKNRPRPAPRRPPASALGFKPPSAPPDASARWRRRPRK